MRDKKSPPALREALFFSYLPIKEFCFSDQQYEKRIFDSYRLFLLKCTPMLKKI